MKILAILAHPNNKSFNRAMAEAAVEVLRGNGHEVWFHDLYEEKFDPLLHSAEIPKDAPLPSVIQDYCEKISSADAIVVVHPDWWGQPPAILKGWLDRIIRAGVAYKFEEIDKGTGRPIGLLKARAALVFNTSNTPYEMEMKAFGDPLDNLWKNCIFGMCGVRSFYRKMYGPVIISTLEQRQSWLAEVRQTVAEWCPRDA